MPTEQELRQGLGDALEAALGRKAPPPTAQQNAGLQIKAELQQAIDRINRDPTLTPIGKNEKVAVLQEAAGNALSSLHAQQRQNVENRLKALESSLFDRATIEGSDPALVVSYRDAAERVAALEGSVDTSNAVALMRSALRNGDLPLQKMLLRAAFDNQWADVLDVAAEAGPSRGAEITELWDLRYPGNSFYDGLADAAAFTPDPAAPIGRAPSTPLGNESRRSFAQVMGIETEVCNSDDNG